MRTVVLRYANLYGPRSTAGRSTAGLLLQWMERIEAGLAPVILGDGSRRLDLVYGSDAARANLLAAVSSADGSFDVADPAPSSLQSLATALALAMGAAVEPEYGPAPAVADEDPRPAYTEAATRSLGFTAAVPLQDGLRRMVDWWRAEGRRTGPVSTVVA